MPFTIPRCKKKKQKKRKKTNDIGGNLCHSTWCPHMSNHIQFDHIIRLKQISEQTSLFHIKGKAEGKQGAKTLPAECC
jgi:hypothetical protein